jgi:hypothetical protein
MGDLMSDTSDIGTALPNSALALRDTSSVFSRHFLLGGLAFLGAALCLFAAAGVLSYAATQEMPMFVMAAFEQRPESIPLADEHLTKLFAGIAGFFFAPLICLVSAFICSFLGIRLLKTSGAVATHVIAPQDYALLGPAIAEGNAEAISLFIRLSSLSGATGTFTKIGLTGLPLATIVLTLILAVLGVFNAQFFDLAKLTLGAFLGSFVQRQAEGQNTRPSDLR